MPNTDNYIEKLHQSRNQWEELQAEMMELARKRSKFSLEHWTTAQEGSVPSHQYKFLLFQIRCHLQQMRMWDIEYRRLERQITRLRETQDDDGLNPDWDLDLEELQIRKDELTLDIKGRIDEMEDMFAILRELKKQVPDMSWEKYEGDEKVYWTTYLARKMACNAIHARTGFGQGEIKAVLDGQQPPVLEESESLPSNMHLLPPEVVEQISRMSADELVTSFKRLAEADSQKVLESRQKK